MPTTTPLKQLKFSGTNGGAMMSTTFHREGELKDLASYPLWLQRVVADTYPEKMRVVNHEMVSLMRDAKLPLAVMRRFMIGAWTTIERFPRFMSMNLKKARYGHSTGEDMARRYLMHNIRVEHKHAQYWIDWAQSAGVTLADLRRSEDVEGLQSLAHWCWYVCDQASLPVAVAATNFAVEGATGEWTCVVCSKPTYAESLPSEIRGPAMRWLRVHAEYDDTHPWEALEIVATLLGNAPTQTQIDEVRSAIRTSYVYNKLGLDDAMTAALHGNFDETASNSSILGLDPLDFADDDMPVMPEIAGRILSRQA